MQKILSLGHLPGLLMHVLSRREMKMPLRVLSVSVFVAVLLVLGGCGTGEFKEEGGGEIKEGVGLSCFADRTCLDGNLDERYVVLGLEDSGSEAEPCYPNDTCNEGFICVEGTCVTPQGEETCVPDCTGRECGVDPVCGEQCLPGCDDGRGCNSEGQCVSDQSVEVLVMFLDTNFAYPTPVDIELNGQRYQFFEREQDDPIWTTSLLEARGVVLEVEGPLSTVAFDPEQIHVEGLNVHGYGLFNYVIQQRHPDANLHQLSLDAESLEYWATAHDQHQIQWSRLGYSDGQEEVFDPNPEFYEIELSSDWSRTGKISILVGGRGHHHPAYGPDEHPDSNDDPAPDPQPLEHPESPVLVPADVQVALTFIDGAFFDVALNGEIYHFSGRSPSDPAWDYAFGDARGQVIHLDHQLATMALDPAQIRVQGLNNEGFGSFAYKVVNKNGDADLYQTNGNHNENPEFWGNAATVDPLGIIVSRMGNTITGAQFPDPLFYFGLLDQDTGSRVFHPSWSATGKIGITFIEFGGNAPHPVPGLEDPWFE